MKITEQDLAEAGFPRSLAEKMGGYFAQNDTRDLTGAANSILGFDATGTAVYRPEQAISPADFLRGTDTTAALHDFFAKLKTHKLGYIPPGDWFTETAIDLSADDWEGVQLYGHGRRSLIRGNSGYAVLKLGNLAGCRIDGIGFQSDYVSAVEDTGQSIVYSMQKSVINTAIRRCYFSNPASFSSALTFYARTAAADTSGLIDGLWIEENEFDRVGRICCTLMNRGSGAADPYAAARRVFFNRNRAYKAGSAAPAFVDGTGGQLHGMLLSLDGNGQQAEVVGNYTELMQGITIENVSWNDVLIADNVGRDFSRGVHFLGLDDGRGLLRRNRVVRNAMLPDQSGGYAGARHSYMYGLQSDCLVEENTLVGMTTDQALLSARNSGAIYRNDQVTNLNPTTGRYAWLIQNGRVQGYGGVYDNSVSAANHATIRFYGLAATGSRIEGDVTIKKGVGGAAIDQASDGTGAAAGNVVVPYTDASGAKVGEYLSLDMPDADTTLSGVNAILLFKGIRLVTTAWTAQRTLTFPSKAQVEHRLEIRNDKNWPVALRVDATVGDSVNPACRGPVVFDPALNSVRFFGPSREFLGTFANLAATPTAAGAGKGARAWINSARNAGEGAGLGTGSFAVSDGGNWRIPGQAGVVTE